MPLYVQPNKILPVITPPVLFPDPVRVLPNSPDGDLLTGTVPMKAERVEIPVPEIRTVSLGDSLAGIEAGVMAEDVFQIPISLNREATSNINDNYLLCPTLSRSVATLGANPRVVSILREGYMLPFKIRPPLTRSPVIKSGYAHPGKSKALFEALIELINKLVVEKVVIRSSLAFYNCLFLVPKSNHRWRPILDLSHLNLFLEPGTFKMETPETIRLSLQRGEWVTSLDFNDA